MSGRNVRGSSDAGLWLLGSFVAVVVGVVAVRASHQAVETVEDQRLQHVSRGADEDLRAAAGCLSLHDMTLRHNARLDRWDDQRSVLVAQLDVTMPPGAQWNGAARQLTASWADVRNGARRSGFRECVFINRLMIDTCCTPVSQEVQPPENPVCAALAACGRRQWE